jgi:hypothetical protein
MSGYRLAGPRHRAFGAHSGALIALVLLVAGVALAGCQYADPNTTYPGAARKIGGGGGSIREGEEESIFGQGGLSLATLGGGSQAPQEGGGGGIGVNSYLWRASLDTVSFMPLLSADPFGGVIITDWYSPPESPGERFKLNIYILGRELRADGLRTAVFRQTFTQGIGWQDAQTARSTATDLENAILIRAREMRIAQTGE